MKVNENFPGIYQFQEQASLEVQLAQRQAELEQLARYRAKRMAQFVDWVKPEEVQKRKEEHAKAAAAALELGHRLSAAMKVRDLERQIDKAPMFKTSAPFKKPLKPWWQRLKDWAYIRYTTFLRKFSGAKK